MKKVCVTKDSLRTKREGNAEKLATNAIVEVSICSVLR